MVNRAFATCRFIVKSRFHYEPAWMWNLNLIVQGVKNNLFVFMHYSNLIYRELTNLLAKK